MPPYPGADQGRRCSSIAAEFTARALSKLGHEIVRGRRRPLIEDYAPPPPAVPSEETKQADPAQRAGWKVMITGSGPKRKE